MAKTTAPLLSFGGSGQIGKTQVYSSWRGVKYARRYVIPANPNTTGQQETRGVFSWLSGVWKLLNSNAQAPWTAYASGKPLTNRNAFGKANIAALRGTTAVPVTDLSGMTLSPGANGGLPPSAIATADGGTHHVTVTLTAPDLPASWTIVKAHAVAIVQEDAKTSTVYESFYANDATSAYAPSIACGTAGTYACFGWFEFLKPDGSTAYGPSLYNEQVIA